nr:putative Ig domain-containing protein [Agrobacterium rubi]
MCRATGSSPAPTITSVAPNAGTSAGGVSVAIAGTNFSTMAASNTVKFGTDTASVTAATATQLTVTTPAHAAGVVNVSVNVGGQSATLTNGYTFVAPVTLSPTSGALPAGTVGTAYSQTVSVSGGTSPYSYALTSGSPPAGLSLNTSTGVISGTPTTGGSFTFTVTATDANSATGSANYTLATAAVVPGAPTIGAATAGDGEATVSFTAPSANGGAAITDYSVTASPGGATATGTSSPITVTGLTNGTAYTFTVVANNSAGSSAASAASNSATPMAAVQLPVANNVSATVAANSSVNPITLNITGGAATSVAIASNPAHGAANISGTSITYTPTAGYSGADSFTYTATNTAGTSTAATVNITVSAPTFAFSPAAGALTGATVGTAYSQTVAASGGASPYTYAVTSGSLPAGLSLNTSTGVISGTPTTAGNASFTVTAADANTATGSAAYTLAVTVTVPGAPTIGTATAGNGEATVSFTAPAANGGATITGYTVTASPGGVTATGSASPITVTGLTNGTAYSFTVVATNSAGPGAASAASNSVTPVPPTFSFTPAAGALTAGIVGASYNETVAASGGTSPYTFAITAGSLPTGLTLNTSTGAISGTPTTGGSSNFTVTATDANNVTGSASYTLAIAAVVPGAPTIGAATAGDGEATVSFTAPSANGGAAITDYSVTASPGGATATGTSSPITVTGLTNGTAYTFTVVANNSAGSSAASAASNSATPMAAVQLPVANNVSATVAANSSVNPITLNITGGAATSVAIASNPAHGAANISGTSITYTPTAGYSGADSFTYTATNTAGTSTAATVNITVSAPTFAFSPAAGALTGATVGTAYSQTVAASGGASPYTYAVTSGSLPAGLSLNTSTGVISGTPTTAGNASFTVTAADANTATGSAAYTLAVASQAVTLTVSPTSGALTSGTVGTAYSGSVSAMGGTAPYTYGATGLPAGLSLNASTGTISGTPTSAGNSSIVVTVSDSSTPANTGDANYTLAIAATPTAAFTFSPSGGALTEAMAGEAYSQAISATGGAAPLIYSVTSGSLPNGVVLNVSTGELTGPLAAGSEGDYRFTIQARDNNGDIGTASYTLKVAPRAVTVDDKVVSVPAGSAPANVNLTAGATGGPFVSGDLTFVEPASAGTVSIVNGEFAQAGGPTPTGWYLKFIPNPAYSGQVRVGFRLTSALGVSNTGTVTYNIGFSPTQVAEDIDNLVHGFVQTRQNMIASTIKVPGLMERRRMETATDPVTARMMPSAEGMTLGFSTSLAQLESARDATDGQGGGYFSPFNIWIDGTFLAHNREENGNKWGNFAMVSAGADYLLSDKALIGVSFHYDRMTDPTNEDATLTGNGWLAGPYASFEIGKNVFWDTSLLYGGSANDIDTQFWDGTFDTSRWLFDTSIKGQWNLDEVTVLTPKLRAVYMSETVDDYEVTNGAGDILDLEGFTSEQLRASLGAEISRQITLDNDLVLTPKIGATAGFSGLDGSGAFAQVSAGLSMQTSQEFDIDFGLLFNIEGDGEQSAGARVGISGRF